jgi:Mrp family chromosome partitioning ATPase
MSYVQDTFVRGVRILPAGKPSLLSSELLAKEKMRNLIKEIPLKLPGHQVIVDTSPVLTTPDPLVLARHVDGIIVVIRARKTPRDCLLKAITSLGSNKVVGVILNDAELGMASKHYYPKRS